MSLRPKWNFFKVPLLVGAMMGTSMPTAVLADTIKIGGTGSALGSIQVLAEAFKKSHPNVTVVIVPGLGSSGGRAAVVAGAIDIGVTSKAGKRAEKVERAAAIEYGRTPFIFATSKKNPVRDLTTQEVVEIWSGKKTTWRNGERLRLVLRPETDSDTDILKAISPAMEQAVKSALSREGMNMAVTDQDSANAIEAIPGALGTSTLALIISEKRSLKALSLDGMTPSPKTIADGSYPYFKSFYMVTRPKPSGLAEEFIVFVLSGPGRKVLAQLGHWIVETKGSQ